MAELRRIEKQILLKAPRARVFRALTNHQEFSTWFGHEMLDPFVVGAVVRARSEWQGRVEVGPFLLVEAIEPEHRFAFRWAPDTRTPVRPPPPDTCSPVLDLAPMRAFVRLNAAVERPAAPQKDAATAWHAPC